MLQADKEVIRRVNKRIDGTVQKRQDSTYRPYVCIICDRLLTPTTIAVLDESKLKKFADTLRCDGFADLPMSHDIVSDYSYSGENAKSWMENLLLSPRASYMGKGRGRGTRCGFSACKDCKNAIDNEYSIPEYAIANKYYFGTPPDVIASLNDVELALLTPLKSYGFVFTYSGGAQRNLKGVLTYFRVREMSIAKSVLQLDVLGLNEHIVVLYTGNFTKEQKEKAKKRCTIRVDKVLRALEWLVQKNRCWVHIDLNKMRDDLLRVGPIVIDESTKIDSSRDGVNCNIETTETFVAYFPDGTMKTVSGGQASIDEFKFLVERSKFNMQELEFQCYLDKKAVNDYEDDNFVKACLLQFPYGMGGMNERRLNTDGSSSSSVRLENYVRYLSYISQPHFHRPLFVLILYSIFQRQKMLRSSWLSVRGDVTYRDFAESLNADDVTEAVDFRRIQQAQRQNGFTGPPVIGGTFVSKKFLDCIDAVTRALPHSNAAAARARTEAESLCHELGFPSVFLSFAPDDESSFILQVFSGVTIDDDTPLECLTDEQLASRAKHRRELRIRNPGLSALTFEIMLEIVLQEIVGVDIRNKKVIKEGFFGLVEAVMVTAEEQGRTTLHSHILLWIKKLQNLMKHAQDETSSATSRKRARKEIAESFDSISATELVGSAKHDTLRKVFDHECATSPRKVPKVLGKQQLRNLRHKIGCAATDYAFARCDTCGKVWTNEQVIELYVRKGLRVPHFDKYPDNCKRLNAMCVRYQKPDSEDINPGVINAAYNAHFSFHTKTCFPSNDSTDKKAKNKKRKRKADECRMRLPALASKRARVCETSETSWYSWDGRRTTKTMIEVNARRRNFDEFQNVSCPVISQSKLTCNSNVQLVAPGPIVVYQTKYTAKANQKQETEDYGRVADEMRKVLGNEENKRKHDSNKSEALRRVLRASFAHNKKNVVGPSMAAWLTRFGSRFMISRDFAWCPLRDLDNLLRKSTLQLTLNTTNGNAFFENSALNYLCRPSKLEDTNVYTFYKNFETRYTTKYSKDNKDKEGRTVLPFENTKFFSHPSFKSKTQHMGQGVRLKEEPSIFKVIQWCFPDSSTFNGSILDERTIVTPTIERYSRLVLMLFLPFRANEDLALRGSHTEKLRHCVRNNDIPQYAFEYLQNVQDSRSNALRNGAAPDELARQTLPFQAVEEDCIYSDSEDEGENPNEEEPSPEVLGEILDDFFLSSTSIDDSNTIPSRLDFSRLMEKGTKQCGYDKIVDVSTTPGYCADLTESFVRTCRRTSATNAQDDSADAGKNEIDPARQPKTRRDIVRVILNCRSVRKRSFPTFSSKDKKVNVKDANGTAASIIDWAKKAKFDRKQMRTFEILASTFVLTFYDRAFEQPASGTRKVEFLVEYKKLQCLAQRSDKKENLVSFVHGPAGAGKSTIIDVLKLYCEEYCKRIGETFTSQTIVVTALTGVAATLLLGETTHRAVYLNRKKQLTVDEIDAWKDTRLLIVDEISFAPPWVFEKLHDTLTTITGKLMEPYGGMNVVFSGDLRQLKPIREKSICDYDCPHFEQLVNCYIELEGKHRFKNDPEWGELLFRFRSGNPTPQDISKINTRVCRDVNDLPPSLRYATFTNRDRDSINTAIFSKYCSSMKDEHTGQVRSAVIVLSDNLTVKNGTGDFVPVRQRQNFWQTCGEDDVECVDKGRVDPVLKLFRNCPVMLTSNTDVKNGKANGTRAFVDHVLLKSGENHFDVTMNDCVIPAVFASQVEYVQLRHENKHIDPQTFNMTARTHNIRAFISRPGFMSTSKTDKEKVSMSIKQLPITSNTATTGHKLQGCGVDNLFVHSWHKKDNWAYVVLSRVRTIAGLFLRNPLSYDLRQYAMTRLLREKIINFRSNKTRPFPSREQYAWMEKTSYSFVGQPVPT